MSKVDNLKKLLTERDETYGEYTAAIENEVIEVLLGIAIFLHRDIREIGWDNIRVEESSLVVSAVMDFEGTTTLVQNEFGELEEVPTIDENGIPLQHVMTFGIPLTFVETRDKFGIAEFLDQMEQRQLDQNENPRVPLLHDELAHLRGNVDPFGEEEYDEEETVVPTKGRILH